MSELNAQFDLPLQKASPGAARRTIQTLLEVWGYHDEDWLGYAVLLVSELVSNALRHGGGCVAVDLSAHDGSVVIGVADGSSVLPRRRESSGSDADGRGLALIEALSTDWGVEERHGGKRVWVRLPHHPAG